MDVTIDSRFRGPPASANGGYTSGVLAALVGGPAEVTLKRPPPLGRPLRVRRLEGGGAALLDGGTVVADAFPVEIELDVPPPPAYEEAEAAAARFPGLDRHAFPTCFVCGPRRASGDGLRIFAGPVRDALVAAAWRPDASLGRGGGAVRDEFVWAALDCPGAIAVGFPERGETLLGRLAARIDRAPAIGERSVVVGWRIGEDGRKLYAGTALFTDEGELLARARATWIAPRDGASAEASLPP